MPKDANAPKRPATGYFRFLSDNREAYVKQHPEAKLAEIGKAMGALWKELSDKERAKYNDAAKAEMAEWKVKMEAYKKTDEFAAFQKEKNQADKKKGKKALKKLQPNKPKNFMTAYFMFCNEYRKNNKPADGQKTAVSSFAKACGAAWKAMTPEMKQPYIDRAEADKARYAKEMEEYKKTEEYAHYLEKKKQHDRKSKAASARLAQKKKAKKKVSSSD